MRELRGSSKPVQRRFKAIIEYDGTDFHGWQRQLNVRTVQEEIESALSQIVNESVTLFGSGRTDSGVHAVGQVAHVSIDSETLSRERLLYAVNSLLPSDVKCISLGAVDSDFHARFDAVSRSYRYHIEKTHHPLRCRYSWCPRQSWDDRPIQDAVKYLVGEYGFRSFCRKRPGEEHYRCEVFSAEWKIDSEGATFEICADRFFHRMVRGIVGALMDVGRGYFSVENFADLLENSTRESNITIAPPQGLTLVEVKY